MQERIFGLHQGLAAVHRRTRLDQDLADETVGTRTNLGLLGHPHHTLCPGRQGYRDIEHQARHQHQQ